MRIQIRKLLPALLWVGLTGPATLAEPVPQSSRSQLAHEQQMGTATHPGPLAMELHARGFHEGSHVLFRALKQMQAPDGSLKPQGKGTLEIWLENQDGIFELFKSFQVDNFSGFLGPKLKEGDHQAPEGFYQITANRLNPESKYHLAMNVGYPNSLDQSLGHTGGQIMIHGTGVSVGCYAMTDAIIDQLYVLTEAALIQGQKSIPVLLFPFPMTKENLASANGMKWLDFWSNLQEGYDLFEADRVAPQVSVKDGRYVFSAP